MDAVGPRPIVLFQDNLCFWGNRLRDGKGTEEVFSSESRHKGRRFSENLLRPPAFFRPVNAYVFGR